MTFTVEYEREDDGRWLAEVVELRVCLRMEVILTRRLQKLRRWPCAYLQTVSSMVKESLNLSASHLPPHEPLVVS